MEEEEEVFEMLEDAPNSPKRNTPNENALFMVTDTPKRFLVTDTPKLFMVVDTPNLLW